MSKVFSPNVFSDAAVERSFTAVTTELGITPTLVMSLSGTYYVRLGTDGAKQDYIVKVRRKIDPAVRQAFVKEARLNQFFSEHNTPFVAPKLVRFYDKLTPEVLAYTLVPGKALGWYYFYTGENQLRRVGAKPLLQALRFLADNTTAIKNTVAVPISNSQDMIAAVLSHRDRAELGGLPKSALETCVNLTKQHSAAWLAQSVLVHGDLNPKNVLVTSGGQLGFIDWSDAHCNNQYYDLAFLWLALWRVPDIQDAIVKLLPENPQEFWQLVTFWLPKFYAILSDVSQALNREFTAGSIPQEAHDDNLRYIQQAQHFYNERLEQIFRLT